MTTFAPPLSTPVQRREHDAQISRVPYLAGLDGIRALAVVAVMVYHANSSWLSGGFLGVEMFFVISGYLITLLIIAERERTYRVSLVDFWIRRARRLLPALFVMMLLVVIYTVFFERSAVGQLRGDVIGGLLYSSNWYQLFVGLGYTAAFDFAPLRHLWSLAVEEQFYVIWPVVMVLLLGRRGTRKIADISRWLVIVAVGITIATALLYHPGVIGEPGVTPDAYWNIGGHSISKLDFSYIGTVSRLPGILLGAAFAVLWRPFAVARGSLRNMGPLFDVFALAALAVLGWMCWNLYLVTPSGTADGRLFRGGLFAASISTIVVIAAVSHPGARANRVLGNCVFVWIGLRSYGLYLYHWPIYQAIRKLAGNKLTVQQFALAMVLSLLITELSYRFVETPVRTGRVGPMIGRARRNHRSASRRVLVVGGATAVGLSMFATATLATAQLEPSEIAEELDRNGDSTTNLAASDASFPRRPASPSRPSTTPPVTTLATENTLDRSTTSASSTASSVPDLVSVDSPASGSAQRADRGPQPRVPPATDAAATDTPSSTTEPASTTTQPSTPVPSTPQSLGVVTTLDGLTPLVVGGAGAAPSLRLIGFGDSVMRGSAEELFARGFVVDAATSRQFGAAIPEVQAIRDNGFLGAAVVVHLGTNGSVSQESLDQMMAILVDVPIVVFVTGKADRVWIPGNNELLRGMPALYPNVTVIDWEVLGPLCPGDCFYSDDIHLNAAGQNYYADIVAKVLGLV
jgi:peptidoglycan/LPS O-acetylase OafA/YrhL